MIQGHGDDAYRYGRPIVSNFSSNVMPGADLSGLQLHLCQCLKASSGSLSAYPEPEACSLGRALADKLGVDSDSLLVTNGATEAIYLIAQAFRGCVSAVLQPTFSEYADACVLHAHRVAALYTLPDARTEFRLPSNVRLLWLCNPNNPTGSVIPRQQLLQIITSNPQVCFVVDQSYEAFTLQDMLTAAEAASLPNVLQLHSMTKQYAVPGLRLGYVVGDASLVGQLRLQRMPWSVNQLAIDAGFYLLQHPVQAQLDRTSLLSEAQRLRSKLQDTGGVEVWPTETHFMLCHLRVGKASALKDYLANEHGILIRDASNFRGLNEQYFRIATQLPKENDRLVDALVQWIMQ